MKISFITFGCKVNQYETEAIRQQFVENGFVCDTPINSDVIVINTCTVTSESDKKSSQTLRKIRRMNPTAIIVLTGCFPQAFSERALSIKEVDIITGTKNRHLIFPLVLEFLNNRQKIVRIDKFDSDEKIENFSIKSYANKTRGFVKIQDGCNQFCSYCIIPYSRGRIRSKSLKDIREEVEIMARQKHKEIVLVGINLGFYGEGTAYDLADAVEVCSEVDEISRVRLGSLEAEKLTDDVLQRLSQCKKLCPQFHISLQSGCDRTLKSMNRKYNTADYLRIVNKIRSLFEDCSITTDIITGFPDETDEDFKQSLEFAKSIGFSKIHVFPYSSRDGTPAAKMQNQINPSVKHQRTTLMLEMAKGSQKKFLQTQIGKEYPVLCENSKDKIFMHGYSPNYTHIKFISEKFNKDLLNTIFYGKIISCEEDSCIAKLLDIKGE